MPHLVMKCKIFLVIKITSYPSRQQYNIAIKRTAVAVAIDIKNAEITP